MPAKKKTKKKIPPKIIEDSIEPVKAQKDPAGTRYMVVRTVKATGVESNWRLYSTMDEAKHELERLAKTPLSAGNEFSVVKVKP